ncbi:MAG TPA: hypothetical protein VMK65_09285 [Longimicrobiales bacterium]|nr:hypothetical protein [Longimicrobiales bacterium]
MIELRDDELVFSFPEVHPEAVMTVEFQHTLRIPDDDTDYPLPPGLGTFPLRHVEGHVPLFESVDPKNIVTLRRGLRENEVREGTF